MKMNTNSHFNKNFSTGLFYVAIKNKLYTHETSKTTTNP
jgi:hypothetical protein